MSSGTAVLQALAEGKPPQQIAQDWFKAQMNLTPAALTHESEGPLGLSWFHLVTMSLLTALAGIMLTIYLVRMRRANALASRLTSAVPVASAARAPLPAAVPPVPSSSGVAQSR